MSLTYEVLLQQSQWMLFPVTTGRSVGRVSHMPIHVHVHVNVNVLNLAITRKNMHAWMYHTMIKNILWIYMYINLKSTCTCTCTVALNNTFITNKNSSSSSCNMIFCNKPMNECGQNKEPFVTSHVHVVLHCIIIIKIQTSDLSNRHVHVHVYTSWVIQTQCTHVHVHIFTPVCYFTFIIALNSNHTHPVVIASWRILITSYYFWSHPIKIIYTGLLKHRICELEKNE